jgi:hypothetical protein
MMLQPIGGHLLVQHGIAGSGGKFQDEQESQAKARQQRDNGARENSLHR